MADDVDAANDLMEKTISIALRERQSAEQAVGTKICVECGDDMPQARQSLGFKLCKTCAEEKERRQSLFAE